MKKNPSSCSFAFCVLSLDVILRVICVRSYLLTGNGILLNPLTGTVFRTPLMQLCQCPGWWILHSPPLPVLAFLRIKGIFSGTGRPLTLMILYDKDVVLLKLHKALYSPRIYVNNQLAGENPFCFTPTILNIKPFLKSGKNEIVIRIYSYKDLVPDTIPVGTDIEKLRYIPGIYDDVELIGTNYPLIKNIQVVPMWKINGLELWHGSGMIQSQNHVNLPI